MSDELHRKLIQLGGKPFRRVRKHKGETWKPDQRKQPNADLGIWCPTCRSNHSYGSKRTLGAQYEKYNGIWSILWVCNKSGNVLKVEGLVRRS